MRFPRREGGAPVTLILALVFPAIIAAALALAYYGYLYAEDVTRRMEATFRQSARQEVATLVGRLEEKIDEATRTVLDRVVVESGSAREEAEACDVDLGTADALAVVRFTQKGRVFVCEEGVIPRKDWERDYLRTVDFSSVQTGKFRYLHQRIERQDVLMAFMSKVDDEGRTYFVIVRLRPTWVIEQVETHLAKLADHRRITVLDQGRRSVAGVRLSESAKRDERFLFERSAGRILYLWDLQIGPRDVETLQRQAERRKVMGPLLVIFSTGIIAVGLLIVWLSVLAERRASRLKSDFIANVSHELKTPLSLIRMFGEMVATGRHKGPAAVQEYGGIITRESERLSHLIDNVLDFARLERGKASYQFQPGDLSDVVERAVDVCRYRFDKEKLHVQLDIEPNLTPVRMDENAMTLVVLNLLDNAIKYAAAGKAIQVSLRRGPAAVVLSVRDHGPGIPPDERPRVFERFYRAQAAREANVRGSGIGLALVHHIVSAHGGRVAVEDPRPEEGWPGKGVAFRVYLPASTTEASAGVEAAGKRT